VLKKGRWGMIKISYDKEGDVMEIRFSEEAICESEYVEESGLVVDYDKEGNIVAIEVVSFSKRVGEKQTIEALAV
jgi:uncharacterized protein YuzE